MAFKAHEKTTVILNNQEQTSKNCHYIKIGYTDSFVREEEAVQASEYFSVKDDFDEYDVFKKIIISSLTLVFLILTATFGFVASSDITFAEDTSVSLSKANELNQSNDMFVDVDSSHWALPFINSLKSSEIIAGYTDGTFKPQANVKINEFIAMTVKALGYRFESMSSDWAKPYVDKAIELKLIQDQEFPSYGAQINREQMTSIVINAVALSEYRPSSALDQYIKNETKDYYLVGDYYKQNVLDSYKFGIISGFVDKTFRPKDFSTRAEASAVISKILNKDLRKPFVKTDAKYTMIPTHVVDEFGNDTLIETAFYAPLYNGKPVNEVVEVAELVAKLHDLGKGYIDYQYNVLDNTFATGGYESKAVKEYIYGLPSSLERILAMGEYSDLTISIENNDFAGKYHPYTIQIYKRVSVSEQYPNYSTYIINTYGDQLKPLFQYLFENEYEKAWNIFVTGLNAKGASMQDIYKINGRDIGFVSGSNGVYMQFSIKR